MKLSSFIFHNFFILFSLIIFFVVFLFFRTFKIMLKNSELYNYELKRKDIKKYVYFVLKKEEEMYTKLCLFLGLYF